MIQMKNQMESGLQKIACNIRECRREKGKTQSQVAEMLNVSQNSYSKLELGKTKLTVIRLLAIAEFLNINVSELLI
ncbi:helix-turn-helix domain-containing protein [Mucilaginibacter aquaedulcis]|uniref:helix-turn-helix domain-containing protein n=1 Tax=Mucilaginibacter aquaedulcis TaxID=1187081 RepID=UPI00338FF3BE